LSKPFRFEKGALLVLDQRRLPSEEVWLRCERPEEVAEAIRTLAVRGAPAIGLAAAYGLALALDGAERCAEEARARIENASRLLASTRPTAVNLAWALERGQQAYAAAEGSGEEREALVALAQRLHAEQDAADRRLAELGAERFTEGDRALTHCNTGPLATGGYGTAEGVLRAAFERGRLGQVWVSETRPLRQGARLTAWELEQEGIPFRVVTDSSAGALMARDEVDRVVVGADRIARNGDVANKIGTYPLAVLAQRHGVPFYVAAPLSTIDPNIADGSVIPIEERDPGEVLDADAPAGAEALNLAFDVTPAELVTAIVTEAGILEPPYEQSIAQAIGD
jgi:methylthioribose-1-phosphate isomerase